MAFSFVFLLMASQAPMYASDTELDLGGIVGIIGNILAVVGFIWGSVKIYQGVGQMNRGEDGWMNIVAGILFAAVPLIANFAFRAVTGDTQLGADVEFQKAED
jgi:hypothetical protein